MRKNNSSPKKMNGIAVSVSSVISAATTGPKGSDARDTRSNKFADLNYEQTT